MSEDRGQTLLVAVVLGLLSCGGTLAGEGGAAALAPDDSLRKMRIRPGLRVELVAAEPLIDSPVAIDWGPDGRLWVVEMRDYPLGMDNRGHPGGRVVCLVDTTGDGRYDRSTVFLDGLLFPTGVMSWGNGVLVTCAPDILYAEDQDGDGKADRREVLFTGFGEANPQHRINGPRWGLDNWVYCANGDFAPARMLAAAGKPRRSDTGFSPSKAEDLRRLAIGGARVKSVRTGSSHDIRNRDFRIRPDQGLLDPQSGQAQFGRDRDDWGNWFGCNHAVRLWHYALDDHYLRRNSHVAAPSARVEAPPSLTFAIGPGRETGTARNRQGQGNPWTSACGVMIYRDILLGPEFTGNAFTCEPVHNLIHRELLLPVGTTFSSRRAADEATSEFLASADPMFTPVSIRTGPDGALWVVDMYRKVLEHPYWLPAGWEKSVDVRAGQGRGRIYRICPIAGKPRPWPRLDRLDVAGLVALFDSPNGWLRDKAQQVLIRRGDRSAVELLAARLTRRGAALGRLHALCTLDGLGALEPDVVCQALSDDDPGVRRHAVRLSESHAARSPLIEAALVRSVSDADPLVRLQLAYSLGEWTSQACAQALGRLLRQEAGEPHFVAAALSSLTRANLTAVVQAVLSPRAEVGNGVWHGLLQSAVGFDEPRATSALLDHLAAPRPEGPSAARLALFAGWLDALDQRNTPLPDLARRAEGPLRASLSRLAAFFEAARRAVTDLQAPVAKRVQAVALLGRGLDLRREDRDLLALLLTPQTGESLQAAAVATLGKLDDPIAFQASLRGWKGYTPSLRVRVLDVLLRRADGSRAILDAMSQGFILPQDIPLTARERLLGDASPEIRRRAGHSFNDTVNPDRNKVVSAYASALRISANAGRGRQVFARVCAACHRLAGIGQAIGPDLAMVRDKPTEWLLPTLLDPNRAVDARYLNYVASTRDGKVLVGILAEEGGNSITLVGPSGERHVILRANLDELASTGKSAMPEGLEKELTVQEMADLIAYLRN
jgi:putative membrane-bound dehydrogenase-like protein